MKDTNDTPPTTPTTWESLGLKEELLKLIHAAGFEYPTPVQAQAIPHALNHEDVIVSAQTGTGKTAAFVFPIIERVMGRNGTYALVLAPTREIATQTQTVLHQFGTPLGIRSVALIGGTNVRADEIELRNYPQVIVATPGRMCDHLDRGNIWLEYLEMLVLDEADRMLDMGFADQLNRILQETSPNRQTLLYSATLSTRVEALAKKILYEPFRIKVGEESRAAHTVDQRFIFVDEDRKLRELERLIYEEKGTIFIFARSKDSAARLWRSLRNRGFHDATQLHSDLEQNVREKALQDFKDGRYRVLIATDVVGRGIHVDDVAHVINYDLPRDAEDYIHRIGRTGRAESSGKATSLVTPKDTLALRKIEKMLGRSVSDSRSNESRPAQAPRPHAEKSHAANPQSAGGPARPHGAKSNSGGQARPSGDSSKRIAPRNNSPSAAGANSTNSGPVRASDEMRNAASSSATGSSNSGPIRASDEMRNAKSSSGAAAGNSAQCGPVRASDEMRNASSASESSVSPAATPKNIVRPAGAFVTSAANKSDANGDASSAANETKED